MNQKTKLPTYYFGLTKENVRGFTPSQLPLLPLSNQIQKIPFIKPPEESDEKFSLSLDVSNVSLNDISVVTSEDDLIVEIEKEYQPDKVAKTNWDKCFGVFTRRFTIPEEVDKQHIHYHIHDNQLQISLFKKSAQHIKEPPKKRTTNLSSVTKQALKLSEF